MTSGWNRPAAAMQTTGPIVAVVVLNFDHFDDTVQCIRSVQQISDVSYTIIVVDNASPDGSGLRLQRNFPNETVILSPVNEGYAAGTNIGIRHALDAGIPYVFVLNPDTIVQPNVLSVLLGLLARHPDAAVATCKTVYDRTGRNYVSAGKVLRRYCAVGPLSERDYDSEQTVSYVAGCAMLVRSDVLRECGILDERFFMYFEDVEFSIRIGSRYRILYSPDSVIRHKSGGGDEVVHYSPFYLYYSSRNRIIAFGGASLPALLHAAAADAANILMKVVVVLMGSFRGKGNPAGRQIMAMVTGFIDGVQGRTGRDPRY